MSLRTEIKEKLVSELSPIGINIYNSRYIPPRSELMPFIIVMSTGDSADITPDRQALQRTESIEIYIYVEGDEEHEIENPSIDLPVLEKLAAIENQVETILNASYNTLDELIYFLTYTGTTREVNIEGEQIIARSVMRYDAFYNEQL